MTKQKEILAEIFSGFTKIAFIGLVIGKFVYPDKIGYEAFGLGLVVTSAFAGLL